VPSEETPRIQECHTLIGHILSQIVEQELFDQEHTASQP
jgi:D-sedoheptulose 7-phosphate isomerase